MDSYLEGLPATIAAEKCYRKQKELVEDMRARIDQIRSVIDHLGWLEAATEFFDDSDDGNCKLGQEARTIIAKYREEGD